jgi:hypothetical protein
MLTLHAHVLHMGWARTVRAVRDSDLADRPNPPSPNHQLVVVPISRRTVNAAPAPASTAV